jgi:histone H3/H4
MNNVTKAKGILSDSCIKRISVEAGVKRLSTKAYPNLNIVVTEFLTRVVRSAIVLMEHATRKTLMGSDIKQSLEMLKYKAAARRKGENLLTQLSEDVDTTISIREPLIPLNTFSRIVRNIAQNITSDGTSPRVSEESVKILRSHAENRLINLLKDSHRIATHSKRTTVKSEDIELVYSYTR